LEQCQTSGYVGEFVIERWNKTNKTCLADLWGEPVLGPIVSGAHVQRFVTISIAIADMELVPAIRNSSRPIAPARRLLYSHGAMNNQALINQNARSGQLQDIY
jgi:hypothetical protein